MEAYLLAANIGRFKAKLAECSDELQRVTLQTLLAEEEAKLQRLLESGPSQKGEPGAPPQSSNASSPP
jgi:hypothetical protein